MSTSVVPSPSQNDLAALAQSVSQKMPSSVQNDFYALFQAVIGQITAISPGQSWLTAGGTQQGSAAAPTGIGLNVSAANGVFSLSIITAKQQSQTIFYEISYCPQKSFATDVVTLYPSSATQVTLNLTNATYFFRVRASYDGVNWSPYTLASNTAASSGLVSSDATSNGGAFNQTNYMNVDSVASGSNVSVRIYGTGGVRKSGVALKGTTQSLLPSASIVNVTPGSNQFVGWNGDSYVLRPTLATVLADNLTPVGKCSVVTTAAPTLPVIDPVIISGYVVGFNVVSGGAGASQPYTLTFGSVGGGAGATFGEQTIENGVLISIAPGNPGNGSYSSGTTVTASGGTGGGTPGGGTSAGGNGGRLSNV